MATWKKEKTILYPNVVKTLIDLKYRYPNAQFFILTVRPKGRETNPELRSDFKFSTGVILRKLACQTKGEIRIPETNVIYTSILDQPEFQKSKIDAILEKLFEFTETELTVFFEDSEMEVRSALEKRDKIKGNFIIILRQGEIFQQKQKRNLNVCFHQALLW